MPVCAIIMTQITPAPAMKWRFEKRRMETMGIPPVGYKPYPGGHFLSYDMRTGKFEDLVKAGVIDPTKVTRTALQNAGSIAGLMLTTEALVAELKEDEKKGAAAGGGPGGPGGGMGGMY